MRRRVTFPSSLCTVAGVGSFLLAGTLSRGQEDFAEVRELNQPTTAHRDVYVDDNFEADESIARAAEWAKEQRWSDAVVLLNRVADQHGDKLTPLERDRYISVTEKINRVIASWPAEGIAAYQRVVEEPARQALAAARDAHRLDRLLQIADRYFCTPVGAEAAALGAQVAVEAGNFEAAIFHYRRLIDRHPDRDRQRSTWLGHLAVVYALSGQADLARVTAEQAGKGAAVAWMGQPQPVGELVPRLLDTISPGVAPNPSDYWPTFGGDFARDTTAELAIDELAMLWTIEDVGEASITPPSDRSSSFRRALSKGRMLSMFPVFREGVAYAQDTARVWAFHLTSGKLLWTYSGVSDLAGRTFTTDGELPHWYSPTLAGRHLYATLGSEVVPYYGYESAEETTALVCLDVESGREVWRADRSGLGPGSEEFSFESSPIVADDKVFVVGRRKRSFGFEDAFLLRFDRTSGRLEFRTHLGSASTGGFGFRRPTLSIPALDDGSILVCTNLGTFASVDVHTGRVRWLTLIERIPEAIWRRDGRGASREQNPWHYNAPLFIGEWVCVMPTDSDDLVVADRQTGRIVKRVPLGELANVQTVFGAEGSRIFGVGAKVFCYDIQAGSMVWSEALPSGSELFGRGVLTERDVLIPTDRFLCAYDRQDGHLTEQEWEHGSRGGNLLAASGKLLVSGNDHLAAYARKQDVLANMRQRMEEHPDDPMAALELAEVLFRTGESNGAAETIDEGLRRAGGAGYSLDEEVRRRVFEDCMTFAKVLMSKPEYDLEAVVAFFERAAISASDTGSHVAYRFAWANCMELNEEPAEAVGLYQQVIADRSLRETPYAAKDEIPEPAGFAAERAIDELIARHGPEVYSELEARASQMFTAGRTMGDVQLLDRLIDSFPNSTFVKDALTAKGDIHAGAGEFIKAAVAYERALLNSNGASERPVLYRKIADAYASAGQPDHAYRWLTRGAREFPSAEITVGSGQMRLLDYRAQLSVAADQVVATRPALSPPLRFGYEHDFEESFWLLDPQFTDLPQTDWQRHLVYVGHELRAYDSASGKMAWPEALAWPRRPELLLSAGGIAVLGDPYQVIALRSATGERLWAFGEEPPDIDDPESDPEDVPRFAASDAHGDALGIVRQDGLAACIEISTGKVRWQRELEHAPTGALVVGETAIVYEAVEDPNSVYVILDPATGEQLRACNPGDPRRAEHLFLTLDGRLIVVTTQTVHCFDTRSGQRLWSTERAEEIRTASVKIDLDGLYLGGDSGRIDKLRFSDGRTVWRSEEPMDPLRPEEGGLRVDLAGDQVLISDDRRVYAVGQASGLIEWEGTIRRGAQLRHRFTARDYFVAIDAPTGQLEEEAVVFFYDLRNASGMIPSNGGVTPVGLRDGVDGVSLRDGAVLMKQGQKIIAWIEQQAEGSAQKSAESGPP